MSCIEKFIGLITILMLLGGCSTVTTQPESAPADQDPGHAAHLTKSQTKPVPVVPAPDKDKFLKAVALLESGQASKAKAVFESLLEIYPDSPGLMANLGVIAEMNGLQEEARAYYEKALSLKPNEWTALNNLLRLQIEAGAFKQAEELANRAASHPDAPPEIAYNSAVLYEIYLHEPSEAIRHYEQYLNRTEDRREEVEQRIALLKREVK